MYTDELERPKCWRIYRNGKLAAEATHHLEAKSIVKQLSKLNRNAYFVVRYEGKAISHCGDKGAPL